MIPIKLALLWHQHQPDYRAGARMALPWVRLHATKDYLEMAQHLEQHPKMHATINLVPSLIKQIEAYQDGIEDDLLHISKKRTNALLSIEKKYLLDECFHANYERMVVRSPRFKELFDKNRRGEEFSDSDFRDLIIHYGLAWTGEFARETEPYASLLKKERDFTEEEKLYFLSEQEKIIDAILPLHDTLMKSGQIEISATPYYHPILPLICDTDSAREAMPDVTLPQKRFSRLKDGFEHVRRAAEIYEERFGRKVQGMWPAEGSISDEALRVLMEENIQWAASDETVLANSLKSLASAHDGKGYNELEKFFPRKFIGHGREIVLFFRDHGLSDKIGFDYALWDAKDAANDFLEHCKNTRNAILDQFGEEALKNACISVILDGENCWEHYYENGKYFLHEFYEALTVAPEIQSVTFSEAINQIGRENICTLSQVVAGSWVGGNFKIWIGNAEKNRGWDLLADAAEALHSYAVTDKESSDHYDDAHTSLLKAEGSDWFWWYGDDNASMQKQIFDNLFRAHLIEVYIHLRLPVPNELHQPIGGGNWTDQGGAMHRAG